MKDIKYIKAKNMITEYTKLQACFEKLIDEVIVGPRSQQNINILQQYILSNGLNELANRVIMSDCPLR